MSAVAADAPRIRPLQPGSGDATRAERARSEPMAVLALGGGEYDVVTAGDRRAVYTVDLPSGSCTCMDYRVRGARCKHLRRVAIDVAAGRVPGPGERVAACGACGARLHVAADAADPVYCRHCTLSPGEFVLDRETDDLLVVVRTTDRSAGETLIEGTGHTVASYPGNEAYGTADRVVEAVYPPPASADADAVARRPPRRYSFPRGRLRRV